MDLSRYSYFAFLALLLSCFLATSDGQMRIVGGTTTTISTVPYMAALFESNSYYCAGSLVTMRRVLTAAHCLQGRKPKLVSVKVGATTLKQSGQVQTAYRFYYASAFEAQRKDQDIGMIVLRQDFIAGANVATIPLCTQKLMSNMRMRVSGWGTTSQQSTVSSNTLRTTTVPFADRQRCRQQYALVGQPLTNSMVCAGNGGQDTCSGDSGGPGVVNGQVCAVVSFGMGCAQSAWPGVYTNINNPAVREMVVNWMSI